jgi:putative dimethyl sulfoxide reductase chaperone
VSGTRATGEQGSAGRADENGAAPSSRLLTPAQLAEARSRTYHLLSLLYLYGLSEDTLLTAEAVPELREALPEPYEPEEAAAAHQHLFGFNIFPFESFFLDSSGLLGGPVSDAVLDAYRQASYEAPPGGESADHIGHELGLLALLSGAEADAHRDGLPAVGARLARQQARFLHDHLLRWLPPLALAINEQGQPFYTALARLTLELALDHGGAGAGEALAAAELPPGPDLLADEQTSLRDIASYLLTPVYSGIYLSRDGIARLARQEQLPRGFGERRQMLLNLFRSAAQYDGLDALLGRFTGLCNRWAAGYARMGPPSAMGEPWRRRAEETAAWLVQMRRRAAQANGR